jgi:membrane fusion protein, multidrug efflux system
MIHAYRRQIMRITARKWVLPLAAAASVALAGMAAYPSAAPGTAPSTPPENGSASTPRFAVEQVGVLAVARPQAFDATVEAVRQVIVASQVQAQIVGMPIKAGDRVASGAVLAVLDSRIAQQQTAAARAALAAAQAELTLAQAELDRGRQLLEKNFISRAALDQAQARHAAAVANVEAASRQAEASSVQGGLHRLTAPFPGRIATVTAEVGEVAQPGRPLATLYDPAALRVVVDVPEPVGRRIGAGTRATVFVAIGGADRELLPVRVTPLPSVDAHTRTMPVRLDLPPGTEGLVPGQYARATFEFEPPAAAPGGPPAAAALQRLSVPRTALVTRGELRAVYVVGDDGLPRLRQVRPGRDAEPGRVEILAGLEPGERVAVDANSAARAAARR